MGFLQKVLNLFTGCATGSRKKAEPLDWAAKSESGPSLELGRSPNHQSHSDSQLLTAHLCADRFDMVNHAWEALLVVYVPDVRKFMRNGFPWEEATVESDHIKGVPNPEIHERRGRNYKREITLRGAKKTGKGRWTAFVTVFSPNKSMLLALSVCDVLTANNVAEVTAVDQNDNKLYDSETDGIQRGAKVFPGKRIEMKGRPSRTTGW
ncbi:hypothetical protein CDD80_5430 [Ophiocordyceps camponoti-rufipedis]|uniref:Uncharacterized protein n=1 Tax=Ophiocordyceps camponoti-rufipedis TaxID=2004952 RepID=A0A2C5YUL7_9HYPO|nr:hypothetical protein CDD80_5430 [Ophiocordyceps camponoti-rufipedis]